MDMTLSMEKNVKTEVQETEKKSFAERAKAYFYEVGKLCAPGVIAMNGGYYVPLDK